MNPGSAQSFLLSRKKRHFLSLENTFEEGIRFIELSNTLIRYKIIGTGNKNLIFSPDPPNTIEHYTELAELLKNDFRVVVFELPGFGFSIPKTSRFHFGLKEMVETSIEFLEKLDLTNNYLCFPCVSGFAALKIAAQRPDLVKKIINVQTPVWQEQMNWVERIDPRKILRTPVIGQLFMNLFRKKIAEGWYRSALPKEQYNSDFFSKYLKGYAKGSCYCLSSGLQGLLDKQKMPEFQAVEQEALIIWGMKDRSHRKTDKESSKANFQNASFEYFEESGHFPELEFPEKFRDLLINF